MRRKVTLAFVALALIAGGLFAGSPAVASGHYTASEAMFPSKDGTMLYAQVFQPSDLEEGEKTPVIVVMTPYQILSLSARPRLLYPELDQQMQVFEKGYSVVQASLRGYGRSEGCGDFGGKGEQSDSVAAVEWSAKQKWSSGKIGMYGISYDAWTQVMALAGKAKGLSAAIVSSPLISAYRGLFMNGIHYADGWHTTPGLYAAIDILSAGAPNEESAQCYATNAYETAGNDPGSPYWKERNLIPRASKTKVPIFWTHGFLDANTKPDNFMDVYGSLRGPHRGWFGQFRHTLPSGSEGNPNFFKEVMAFFQRHLKGRRVDVGPGAEVQDGGTGLWRIEKQWPPADARPLALPLKAGTYSDSYEDDQGSGSDRGVWTFSQQLPYDVHLSGLARLNVVVEGGRGGSHVHARIFDVTGERATLISRGAKQVPGTLGEDVGEARIRFDLYPQDWRLEKGHRIGIMISGADNDWFDPGITGANISVKGAISVPFLRLDRTRYIFKKHASQRNFRQELSLDAGHVAERTIKMPLPPRLR
jgi:predicted acyl esterase